MNDTSKNSSPHGEKGGAISDPRCVICRSIIFKGAKKCIECDSYQNGLYRFFVGFDIKSIVTIIPIATLAFVFVKDQMVTQQADIRIAPLSCQEDSITVAVANLGNRDALFAGVELVSEGSPSINLGFNQLQQSELLVKQSETRVYKLNIHDNQGVSMGLNLEKKEDNCLYKLRVRALDFEQSVDELKPVCACPKT